MTKPSRFLWPMLLFLGVVAAIATALGPRLEDALRSNVALNGVIVFTLVIGALYILRQVWRLQPEILWIERFETRDLEEDENPPLLAPLANLARSGSLALSPMSLRSIADGIASRLDERREIARYLVALLVFLGLLGTFWGLLSTISAIGNTISGLKVDGGDVPTMFEDLKAGLQAPLSGMGTAFSSSLFGLAGSLVLGFLDLQLGQAQNRFFNELEDWLSVHVMPLEAAAPAASGGSSAQPTAYMKAIMAQSADSLESLERRLAKSDGERDALVRALGDIKGVMTGLEERLDRQSTALLKLAEATEASAGRGQTDLEKPLRQIDQSLQQLLEAQAQSRTQMSEDIQVAASRFSRTIASLLDDMAAQQEPKDD